MIFRSKDKEGLFKSILTAYVILLLHVILLAGVGVTVVLFRGVYHYLPWIMAGIGVLVLAIAFVYYQQMKRNATDIRQILSMPEFQDRTVEVRLLGGLASFKIKARAPLPPLLDSPSQSSADPRRIEHAVNKAEQEILQLNALYEKNLITKDEFEKARLTIIQG